MADLKAQRYIAAFVDLLGQRQEMERIELFPDPDNPESQARVENAMRACVTTVWGLHKRFSTFLDVWRRSPAPSLIESLPLEQRGTFQELASTQIRVQGFSDGLVFFCPLSEGVPAKSVFAVLAASGASCLWQLAVRQPIRVGVDLHWGVELGECGLYGPVVANAYELESKIAGYPRVVVGVEVARYLGVHADHTPCNEKEAFTQALSRRCLEMLEQDVDGRWIVDYLGPGFRSYAAHRVDPNEVMPAYRFAKRSAEMHRAKMNTKLASRYQLLLQYMERKLPLWGIVPDDD